MKVKLTYASTCSLSKIIGDLPERSCAPELGVSDQNIAADDVREWPCDTAKGTSSEASMPEYKSKTSQDRKLVAATQPYEVAYFAKKHGLTIPEARAIIKAHGPARRKCDAAARHLVAS